MSKTANNSEYGWVIVKDHLYDSIGGKSSVGIMGPRDCPMHIADNLVLSETKYRLHTEADDPDLVNTDEYQQFRLFDDDGELYYEGIIIGDYTGFEPLDDFGSPAAGCTSIQYLEKTLTWVTI